MTRSGLALLDVTAPTHVPPIQAASRFTFHVSETMTYIIEARDLSKHFGGLRAVDGVNLHVREGSLHSIIGPNGAGKTTMFNLISGTLKPTRGKVFLRGKD